MYFRKIRHPSNFIFASSFARRSRRLRLGDRSCAVAIADLGGDVHRVRVGEQVDRSPPTDFELTASFPGASAHEVHWDDAAGLSLRHAQTGRRLLSGVPGASFGLCGDAWLVQFRHSPAMRFYGLGEHNGAFEKSGSRVKFWNTDVVGDFSPDEVANGLPNPMYVAIPWLIIKQANRYVGLLVHHAGAVFMDLASDFIWDGRNPADRARRSFYLGAPYGPAEIYFIVGPSLPELTSKLQTLVGRTPLPPLWALGHHQCRWGYAGPRDLRALDHGFRSHRIPTDGLWLDIDYMDRYKVFTFAPRHWGSRHRTMAHLRQLAAKGRRVVPILDPGVKVEAGYDVYQEGRKAGVFCLNPAGAPYVGFVWPGQTHLPDFSLPKTRAWWAERVRALAELGIAGAWLDMNDPSVGAVELDDMLFARGTQPHEYYHNQYALGMARASRAGFLAARPDERPFLLSRSGCISSSRYTAIWTGDNVSNWHHLRNAIPISLNLALSGVPFNGPDVCGFAGDTTEALAIAWYKAGFLFPFFRNHSIAGSRAQEPWAFGRQATRIIAHYIRLRYKLLPYLYHLFIAQERSGAAILRPLLHDFADRPSLPLDRINDQFLVGSALLQAPIVTEGATRRRVVLPGDGLCWYEADTGRWRQGDRTVTAAADAAGTPLFVREGSLVPMQAGARATNENDLGTIELHCFLRRTTKTVARLGYEFDDGLSFDYRRGQRTSCHFAVRVVDNRTLAVEILATPAYRPLRVRLIIYDRFDRAICKTKAASTTQPLVPHRWRFLSRALATRASAWFEVGA
jgi:alpha-glucosidase